MLELKKLIRPVMGFVTFAACVMVTQAAPAPTLRVDTNLAGFSSTLPLVVINTFGHSVPALSNAPVWMQVINLGTNQRASVQGAAEFSGPVKIKLRGFSSLRQPKKSYAVETLDAAGGPADVPLLGMPADHDWILYAPYSDMSLMRDVLAYELSSQLGHYASRTRFVEVFLNDTTNAVALTNYVGVYVLEEKIKIAPQRVALHKLSTNDQAGTDLEGGYLFKKDHLEKAGVELPPKGPAHSKAARLFERLPTGPGGFPAAASGFLPAQELDECLDALSIVTNSVTVTNLAAGTNVLVPAPSVTVVRTNSLVVTNHFVNVTNSSVATNLVVATNYPVVTNLTVTSKTVVATNPVVAAQTVTGTNQVATTNPVDPNTVVITTTLATTISTTYRTNFVVSTNTVALTNASVFTNTLVSTNSVVVTNISVASVPVLGSNYFLSTNVYSINPKDPPPGSVRLVESGDGFLTTNASAFFFVEPRPEKITAAQRAWLTNYLNRFETALYGSDFRNPTNGYAAFIDTDSFIDHHLFVEATKNIDGYRFSTFFTKDRGGKLKMEPVWDWNLSFGNARGKQGYLAENWYWPQLNDHQYSWFRRLFEDPDFGQRYVDRWSQWRTNVFANSSLLARVDRMAVTLQEPAARNFERWPVLGVLLPSNHLAGTNYAAEISQLKSWITNRVAWMDAQFVPPPVIARTPGGPSSVTVQFIAPTGQVYVTTDGTDPRGKGGEISVAARTAPTVTVSNAVRVIARVRHANGGWSSPVSALVGQP